VLFLFLVLFLFFLGYFKNKKNADARFFAFDVAHQEWVKEHQQPPAVAAAADVQMQT
jgi:hypothetical protein